MPVPTTPHTQGLIPGSVQSRSGGPRTLWNCFGPHGRVSGDPPYHSQLGLNSLLAIPPVYPSLESDEDSPVFKSRSKKRKGSDDAPYSPTGRTEPQSGFSIFTPLDLRWAVGS